MKIIYNDTHDAKIASVVLYQKFALNYGIEMKSDDFKIVNDSETLSDAYMGEYICIVGVPADIGLYNKIKTLIETKQCRIMYINTLDRNTDIIDKLYQLNEPCFKIICDHYYSLSLLAWIISRYNINDDVSVMLRSKPYKVTDGYEYLIFRNDVDANISIPWLIRFITDYVCNIEYQIPETGDFVIAINNMMDIPSNHINWDLLLTDDREVMQLMSSGTQLRQYVDHINNGLLKHKWYIPDGVVINDYNLDFHTFIQKCTEAKKFYVKMFYTANEYIYHIYFNAASCEFIETTINHYFGIDINSDVNNFKIIDNNIVEVHMNHNVFQSNTTSKLNKLQCFIKKLFRI